MSDIKKFIPKVTPTNQYDFFSSIDLVAVSTNEVLQLLKQTINSINFNSISQSAKDIMTKIYCEKIITDASFVLDPECIPLIFKRFGKLAVSPARELQGIDYSEYEELVNIAMEFCKTNFSKDSIWVLQDMAVRNAKGCEKRLENMIKGSKNG